MPNTNVLSNLSRLRTKLVLSIPTIILIFLAFRLGIAWGTSPPSDKFFAAPSVVTDTNTPTNSPTATPMHAGDLDPSFGTNGKASVDIYGGDYARDVVVQTDGKIIVGGTSQFNGNEDFSLARFNPDGTLDINFGVNGTVRTPFDNFNSGDKAWCMALQPDGKIILAGTSATSSQTSIALARYNSDGVLDTTFDGDGKVAIPNSDVAFISDMALQPDGKIVLAGDASGFLGVRLNSNGSLDNTFDGDGILNPSFGHQAYAVKIQPDGRIIFAGYAFIAGGDTDFALLRCNPDGSLDTTFGSNGTVTTPIGPNQAQDTVSSLALQSGGKIVAGGYTSGQGRYGCALARYNNDGSIDSSFGTNGKTVTFIGAGDSLITAMVLDSVERIVVSASARLLNGYPDFAVGRYTENGESDITFGSGGTAITPFSTNEDTASAVRLQTDGRIIVAGYDGDYVVARYEGASNPSPTATSTVSATSTATYTPTPGLPPTLGNYPDTSLMLSGNTQITPDAIPMDAAKINVSTSTNFLGNFEGDPLSGIVRITNARPAGAYLVTVTAIHASGLTAATTFTMTVTAPTTCNPVTFAPVANFSTAHSGNVLSTVGDFNRDGKQDFAVADGYASVLVLLGTGTGAYASPFFFAAGTNPRAITVGDFNGDGKQDLAVANVGSNDVSILLGDGTGNFGAPTNFAVSASPWSVAVGDFNQDNRQDLVVAHATLSNVVSVLLGNGEGGFTVTTVGAGSQPEWASVGDFNGDGKHDLAVANYSSNNVSILLGDGAGGFSAPTNFGVGSGPASIAVGDLNGDHIQDLAVGNLNGGSSGNVSILLGNGAGGFASATNVGSTPRGVTFADFNGDGNQDLAELVGASVYILLGDGTGSLGAPTSYSFGSTTGYSFAVGDFNGDGKQDLGVTYLSSTSLSIRLRSCAATPTITPTLTATATATNTATPISTATNTPMSTATATFTPTGVPSETPAISGTVTYGNAVSGPTPPRFVSNVMISGTGSPIVSTITAFPDGTYMLSGFGASSYTVTPSKAGGINGSITSFDAAKIAQHVAGVSMLTGNQLVVADVSGNGTISSFDAGQIARYVAAVTGSGSTGNWIFTPLNKMYASVTTSITGEDYSALLMGEISGNWSNAGARPIGSGIEKNIAVDLPKLEISTYKDVVIPVSVQGVADKGIVSYEFDLRYDPSVIQPSKNSVDLAGTASRGLSAVVNASEPGVLRVVVYGPMPINENGVLLNLRFTPVGKPGSSSTLSFDRIMFNEGEPRVSTTDGHIELF
jgi:uncharacterized delta-60 repeat protein